MRKCIPDPKIQSVLHHCHSAAGGGHYGFGVPKALINDQGSHFYNRSMAMLLEKYGMITLAHYKPIVGEPMIHLNLGEVKGALKLSWE
ncbi:hypothetical protein CR513_15932, partial [Mucuna pruriens]